MTLRRIKQGDNMVQGFSDMLREHHDSYVRWDEFERNQKVLATNAYGKTGGIKSGRGGKAFLAAMLTCEAIVAAACASFMSVAASATHDKIAFLS